jgi:hypothetical protein
MTVFLLALVGLVVGCRLTSPGSGSEDVVPVTAGGSSGDGFGPPGGTVTNATLKADASYFAAGDAVTVATLTPATAGSNGTIVARFADPAAVPVPGKVLVVTEGAGQVVKVKSVTTNPDGTTTIVTEPGRLSDAFDTLDMTFTTELTPETLDRAGAPAGQMLSPSVAPGPGTTIVIPTGEHREITGPTIDLTPAIRNAEVKPHVRHDLAGTVIYDNGKVKVEIVEGAVEVYAWVYADYHLIQDSDIKYFLSIKSTATVKTTVSQALSVEGEVPIPSAAWAATLKLGKANVRLKVGLFAGYQVEADAAMSVQSTFSYSERIDGAISYNTFTGISGGTKPNRSHSFTRTSPTIEAQVDATARVYLRAQVLLDVLSTTAVELSTDAFARLIAEYHYSNVLGHSYAWLLDLGVSFLVQTFPEKPNLPVHLAFEGEKVLATYDQHRRLVYGKILGDPTGVKVSVTGQATDLPGGPFSKTVDVKSDGTYVVSGVPKGEMTVTPSHQLETFEPATVKVAVGEYDLRDKESSAPKDIEKDFEMLLVIDPVGPINTTIGGAVDQTIVAHGGKGTRNYTWTATNLPPGLTLTKTATPGQANIVGTVGAGATNPTYTATVKVEDDAGSKAERQVVFNLRSLQITNLNMPAAQVGTAYSHAFGATGGTAPYSFTITGLPAGLSGNAQGQVAGTPGAAAAGTHQVTVRVQDSSQPALTAQQTVTLAVDSGGEIKLVDAPEGPIYVVSGSSIRIRATSDTKFPDARWTCSDLPTDWTFSTENLSAYSSTAPYSYYLNINPKGAAGKFEPTFTLQWNNGQKSLSRKFTIHVATKSGGNRSYTSNWPVGTSQSRFLGTLSSSSSDSSGYRYEIGYSSYDTRPLLAEGTFFNVRLIDGESTLAPYDLDGSVLPDYCRLYFYQDGTSFSNYLLLDFKNPGEYAFTVKQAMKNGDVYLFPLKIKVKEKAGALSASPWGAFEKYIQYVYSDGTPYGTPFVKNIEGRQPVVPLNDSYAGIESPTGWIWIEEWKTIFSDFIIQEVGAPDKWMFKAQMLSLAGSPYSIKPQPGTTYRCVLYLAQPDSTNSSGKCGRIPFTLQTPSPSDAEKVPYN